MNVCGVISGTFDSSYIYLITFSNYVYFGETGYLPVKRWGGHFSSNGTFVTNLLKKQNLLVRKNDEFLMISVKCSEVESENSFNQKIARRAIEAELHRHFLLDPGSFGPDSILISNPPPDPTRFKFGFDPSNIARNIYKEMITRYDDWVFNSSEVK